MNDKKRKKIKESLLSRFQDTLLRVSIELSECIDCNLDEQKYCSTHDYLTKLFTKQELEYFNELSD